MSSVPRICDADAPGAARAAARTPRFGFSSLPQPLLRHILALLPVDARARSAAVHPSWSDALVDPALWARLDLSRASGIARERVTLALFLGAAKRAAGQLVSLDLRDCYSFTYKFDEVVRVARESRALQVVHLQQYCHNADEQFHGQECDQLMALLLAAPQLQLLHADLYLLRWDFDTALQMLHSEGQFTPLRLGYLTVSVSNATVAEVVQLMAALPSHSTITGLELCCAWFEVWPGALLDAVVTAALASQLTTVVFYECELGPGAAPALARLLSGTSLTSLRIAYDDAGPQLDEDAAVLLADALRANSALTSLEIANMHIWSTPAVGAALFAALVAHPSLQTFVWSEAHRCEHEALAGLALHALVAANAPALRHLDVHVWVGNGHQGPLLDALPRNTHLCCLDFSTSHMDLAFARHRLLPAVRANTSLRRLFDPRYVLSHDEEVEEVVLEAMALVNSRGGLPA